MLVHSFLLIVPAARVSYVEELKDAPYTQQVIAFTRTEKGITGLQMASYRMVSV